MNVIITGADGQLGTSLKKYLKSKKINYLFYNKKKLDICRYDKLDKIFKKIKPKIIINCAAFTNVDLAEENKKKCESINFFAVKNLIKISKKYNTFLIHFSTDYIFSGKKGNYNENDKANPINFYGYTKLKAEKIIQNSMDNYLILRISWLMSKYKNNFLNNIKQKIINKEAFSMVNDQIGNPTLCSSINEFIENFCLKFYSKNILYTGVFHLSNEPQISKYDFSKFIFQSINKDNKKVKYKNYIKPIKSKNFKNIAKRPLNTSFNLSKIKKTKLIMNFNWKKEVKDLLKEIDE